MKMEKELEQYLTASMTKLVKDVLKSTLKNPKETAFLIKSTKNMEIMHQRRKDMGDRGNNIPGFLIASITNACNLFCSGCYARANGMCNDDEAEVLLTAEDWESIFSQSAKVGIAFILLAGGEPLLRKDVIKTAAKFKEIVFPVFTNGTILDDDYLRFFDENRNMVPILSLEGNHKETDERRGKGVYQRLYHSMSGLKTNKILFAASLTVTTENIDKITAVEFIENLQNHGCRGVLFIEYVAVDGKSQTLEIDEKNREKLAKCQESLRKKFPAMVFISFPGDEKQMGGCLAAGRGFFHISPQGNAEACPFSPFADCNLKEVSLLEALKSPFFDMLRQKHLVGGEHSGGCALFQREAEVKECLKVAKLNKTLEVEHDLQKS
ncbi:MAG: radical SAM protein [Clostridiales bacterium]